MTTARTVPVTTEMDGDELDAEDAWHLARRHGLRTVHVRRNMCPARRRRSSCWATVARLPGRT